MTVETIRSEGLFARAKGILFAAVRNFFKHDMMAAAAAVAFYAMLAFFPALGAFVSLYGLIADVSTVNAHLTYLRGFLPPDVLGFVSDEITRVASNRASSLSFTVLFSLIFSIWSANAGVGSLIGSLNLVYDQRERRSILMYYVVSLSITVCALAGFIAAFAALVVFPVARTILGFMGFDFFQTFRWPLLWIGTAAILAGIYRHGPVRQRYVRRKVWTGALIASAIWLLVSLAFAWYVAHLANYTATYGSLGAVIGFMVWLWLGMMTVLFGAEVNAQLEMAARV